MVVVQRWQNLGGSRGLHGSCRNVGGESAGVIGTVVVVALCAGGDAAHYMTCTANVQRWGWITWERIRLWRKLWRKTFQIAFKWAVVFLHSPPQALFKAWKCKELEHIIHNPHIQEECLSNAVWKISHTRSGHTSVRMLFFHLCIHGSEQEVTEPLFFLSPRTSEEVKGDGEIVDVFRGAFFFTCTFGSRISSFQICWHCRLTPVGICSLCQLDTDGILWVPYPLPSQHRWQ